MKKRFRVIDFPVDNKTVLVRASFNVPIKNKKVLDNKKIQVSLPTIEYLLQRKAKIVLISHLGRPNGRFNSSLTLDPIAKELKKLLPKTNIIKLDHCLGRDVRKTVKEAQPGEIILLENLRFHKEEEQNDTSFAHSLANLGDYYINADFSTSHRKHASLHVITKFLPSATGLSVEKELASLSQALKPKKPFIWILGGAKLDKLSILNNALKKADYVLVGGALAFSFLKAKGFHVGMSKTDTKSISIAKKILKKKSSKKIILPVDFVVNKRSKSRAKPKIVSIQEIPMDQVGFDIGPKTVKLFKTYLQKAKTIIWNGPLGYFEVRPYDQGTKQIANFISKLDSATTIIGGGETSEAIKEMKLEKKMTHVSTGGGATLAFLSGEKLPALVALEKNYKRFKKKFKQT